MKLRITAPMRVDIGGGVTDVPQFSEEVGTAILNIALDLYSDPGYSLAANVVVEVSDNGTNENRLFFNGKQYALTSSPGDSLRFVKKIILNKIGDASGGNIDVAVFNTLPPGTGLGGSAVLSLCLFTAMNLIYERSTTKPSSRTVLEAHEFETVDLGVKGGFQDYLAAYFGGCNYIDFPSLSDTESRNHWFKSDRE
jgi:galactokinase/mevalonate kinase-like predicted kinase